ncbi:MAG: two-component system chemotaxis sensor kinase CheA [Myxococcota bacterium]|jgi:two-component system chemotaxis sensor kinase CheA
MAKYRALFLEEATEHLAEIGRALFDLEKDPASAESIDVIFRMAHSIKSMAASVGYDSVTEVSHALEDRMETVRSDGRVPPGDALSVLFRGLEGLEMLVETVRETGEPPPTLPDLVALLSEPFVASEPTHDSQQDPVPGEAQTRSAPPDVAELDVELVAVMAALEAESGAKKKLWN